MCYCIFVGKSNKKGSVNMCFEDVQDEGFECEDKYVEFLNSEEGLALENMYALAYDYDNN